eukprot:3532986-Amphidinium_carterae.3
MFYSATYNRVGVLNMYTTSSTSRRLTSTGIDGIYMLSASKQQAHHKEAQTIFEGNNKSDTTAGSTTTYKNWASELQIYMSLEDHNIIDITERNYTPINDKAFIKHELDKQGLSRGPGNP